MSNDTEWLDIQLKQRSQLRMLCEVLVCTVIFMGIVQILAADNAQSMSTTHFPWALLFPIFCALYFNTLLGLVAFALMASVILIYETNDSFSSMFTHSFYIGSFLLTALVGLFRSNWQRRINYGEQLSHYLHKQLNDLSQEYFLLKLSHERLEHSYMIKPMSFRDAIFSLKAELSAHQQLMNQDTALTFLTVIAQYCVISHAAVVWLDPQKQSFESLANLGNPFEINADDPLIKSALENRVTRYVAVNQLLASQQSQYLAVIPFIRANSEILGMTIIKDMPFWSLNEENLEVITVLASVLMMNTEDYSNSALIFQKFPTMDRSFLAQMNQLIQLKQHHRINSGLVTLLIPPTDQQTQLAQEIQHFNRVMDQSCTLLFGEYSLLLVLLPFTPLVGLQSYKNRLDQWLKQNYGLTLNQNGLFFRYRLLTQNNIADQLDQCINQLTQEIQQIKPSLFQTQSTIEQHVQTASECEPE
jgi:hypothetical protein